MVKLLVIADDFTGALDTGVQFKAKDSFVLVYKRGDQGLRNALKREIQVLIVDTETRHLTKEEAFSIIFDIVHAAVELGISYIYKKTDSGMRGNIGSELTAFLKASGASNIHYIPAFPQMGRITVNGIHYVDGVPVSESVFGQDPFEPVKKSAVKDIIADQSDVNVWQMGQTVTNGELEGILVYDSAADEEMYYLAEKLKEKKQLRFLAGCAGFAAVLFGVLGLESQEKKLPDFNKGLLTVCGSINPVTVKQLDYASAAGMHRICLTPEQKLGKGWLISREGQTCISDWKKEIQSYGDLIIECGVHNITETSEYMNREQIELMEARRRIADIMGEILERLLEKGVRSTLLVTGGDTLLAFMQHIKQNTITPLCELGAGVVLSRFEYRGETFDLISKSGGFGQDDLLVSLARLVKAKTDE